MKKEHTEFYFIVLENVRKIMIDRNLTQLSIGEMMDAGESSISRILSGRGALTLDHLANLASNLSMSVTDIITYQDQKKEAEPVEAILQFKLKKAKKEQVLKLVFGENNVEILNK